MERSLDPSECPCSICPSIHHQWMGYHGTMLRGGREPGACRSRRRCRSPRTVASRGTPSSRLAARAPVQPGTRTGAPRSLYGPLSWYIMGYPHEMSLLITNKIKYRVDTLTPATTHRPARWDSARQATGWSAKGPWMRAREMDGMPETKKKMRRCDSRGAGAGT